ncbi:MAG: hypothetical protein LUE97_05385, partial [Oscillospiraceae bacterium]|nr:hypothetical protein [Oscillospiraceae bacterium]
KFHACLPAADAEGGLKPRLLRAGVRRGLGAAGHQQAAEVYTEALLATICLTRNGADAVVLFSCSPLTLKKMIACGAVYMVNREFF